VIPRIECLIEDWIYNHAPAFVEEIARYGIYSNLLVLSLLTILNLRIILGLIHIRKLSYVERNDKYNDFPIVPLLIVTFITSFAYSLYCASEFLKSLLAPHLYALEQVLGR